MALRYDDAYKIVKPAAGTYFVYKISKEEGARLAHLIDVFPLSKKMVEHSVKHIYDNEKNRVDGISYVGKLRSRPANLFKVPKIFQPKPLRMAGRILISGLVDDRIFDLNNWNVNLSNFDAR